MANIGGLDREGSTLGATAESDGHRDRHDDAEVGGALLEDAIHRIVTEWGVTDIASEHDDRSAAEERREVHVVCDIKPLGVSQAA
jgi:hypothetical protein